MSKFSATASNPEDYLKYLTTLNQRTQFKLEKGIQDPISERICQVVKKITKDEIKILIIGCGAGDKEKEILDQIRLSCPEKEIALIDVYEPNPNMFKCLEVKMKQNGFWGSNPEKIHLHQESIGTETRFPGQYDVILVAHVFYYFYEKETRQNVFVLLESVLLAQGAIILIQEDKEYNGKPNQVQIMSKTFLQMLEKASGYANFAPYMLPKAIAASDIHQEILEVKKDMQGDIAILQAHLNMGDLNNPAQHWIYQDILSLLLACNIKKLPREAHLKMIEWIKRIGTKGENGEVLLLKPVAVMIYRRNM